MHNAGLLGHYMLADRKMRSGDVNELYHFILFLHVARAGGEKIFKRWVEGTFASLSDQIIKN